MEHVFKVGDIIKIQGKRIPYEIVKVGKRTLRAAIVGWSGFSEVSIPMNSAVYCPPVNVTLEQLRRFARYEITYDQLAGAGTPLVCVKCDEPYAVTAEDLLCVFKTCAGKNHTALKEEWSDAAEELERLGQLVFESCSSDKAEACRFIPADSAMIHDSFEALVSYAGTGEWPLGITLEELTDHVEQIVSCRNLPLAEKNYTDRQKRNYLVNIGTEDMLKTASETELRLYVRFTVELCAKGDRDALIAKGHACCGGNAVYPCDWEQARDIFLSLCEEKCDPSLANTLGNIYYYGRCNDGVPQYDEAFRWFSIGAVGGICESRCKLAEMLYLRGYGAGKNEITARTIMDELYEQTLLEFLNDGPECSLAEVALRLGNLIRDNTPTVNTNSPRKAYYYYLQAAYAIKQRIARRSYYGDKDLVDSIRKSIEDLRANNSLGIPKKTVRTEDLSCFLGHQDLVRRYYHMKLKKTGDDEYKITIRVFSEWSGKAPSKILLTLPEAHFCGMVDTVNIKAKKAKIYIGKDLFDENEAEFVFDGIRAGRLLRDGQPSVAIYAEFYYSVPASAFRKYRFASLVFPGNPHRYDYLCDIDDLHPGDKVIVSSAHGLPMYVSDVFERSVSDSRLPISQYEKVVGKA